MKNPALKTLLICALSISVGSVIVLSYVHAFVYTRVEATKLEDQVKEGRLRTDSLLIETGKISGKLDALMILR